MPKQKQPPVGGADRTAAWRQRQQAQGLTTITLVVPEAAADEFRERARQARAAQPGTGPLSKAAHRIEPGPPIGERPAQSTLRQPHRLTADQQVQVRRWSQLSGLPWRTQQGKLAEILARNLAHEIHRLGWPVGRLLGAESLLMQRYGVGRNVLREAVRLLEVQGVAEMRRGSGGGLVVTAPSIDAALYASGLYLEYRRVTLDQLIETRRALELSALRRLMRRRGRLPAAVRAGLPALLEAERAWDAQVSVEALQHFHRALVTWTGDPALFLFHELVLALGAFHATPPRAREVSGAPLEGVRRRHAEIAAAILDADATAAEAALIRYFDGLVKWMG